MARNKAALFLLLSTKPFFKCLTGLIVNITVLLILLNIERQLLTISETSNLLFMNLLLGCL